MCFSVRNCSVLCCFFVLNGSVLFCAELFCSSLNCTITTVTVNCNELHTVFCTDLLLLFFYNIYIYLNWMVLNSTIQDNSVRNSDVQFSTEQNKTIQKRRAWCRTVQKRKAKISLKSVEFNHSVWCISVNPRTVQNRIEQFSEEQNRCHLEEPFLFPQRTIQSKVLQRTISSLKEPFVKQKG